MDPEPGDSTQGTHSITPTLTQQQACLGLGQICLHLSEIHAVSHACCLIPHYVIELLLPLLDCEFRGEH